VVALLWIVVVSRVYSDHERGMKRALIPELKATGRFGFEPSLSYEDGTTRIAASRERVENDLPVSVYRAGWSGGIPIVERGSLTIAPVRMIGLPALRSYHSGYPGNMTTSPASTR
jgi:hypothetical protein